MNLETRAGGQALRKLVEYVKAVPDDELENLVEFAQKEQGQTIADVDVSALFLGCAYVSLLLCVGLVDPRSRPTPHTHTRTHTQMADGRAINKALYDAMDGISLLEATTAQLTVGRFLNRLLMLPIPQQNLLFELFGLFHSRVVADAKQAGTHDEGAFACLARRCCSDPITPNPTKHTIQPQHQHETNTHTYAQASWTSTPRPSASRARR